jgi:hypothetical protein
MSSIAFRAPALKGLRAAQVNVYQARMTERRVAMRSSINLRTGARGVACVFVSQSTTRQ